MPLRILVKFPEKVAEHLGCSRRSAENYAGKGYFPIYTRPGERGYLADLAEVDAWVSSNPPGVKIGRPKFGPNTRIVQLAPRAQTPVVITPTEPGQ